MHESATRLEARVVVAFSRIEVKPPFTTSPIFGVHQPTSAEVAGVAFRLLQLDGFDRLLAITDGDFDRRVGQVWELVRWIRTNPVEASRT